MSKIFWQQTIEGQIVEFDNTLFVVSEIRKLDCQFGKHYLSWNSQLALVVFISRVHVRLAAKQSGGSHNYGVLRLSPQFDEASLGSRKLKEKKH